MGTTTEDVIDSFKKYLMNLIDNCRALNLELELSIYEEVLKEYCKHEKK